MNFQDQLLLAAYLIKSAGSSSLAFRLAQEAARRAVKSPSKATGAAKRQIKTPSNTRKKPQQQAPATLPPPAFLSAPAVPALPPPAFLSAPAVPALAAVAPAAAAAMPTGLGLARQGLGQVMTGTGQAIRGGAGAIRNRVSSGANAVRSGLVSAANNPLVQAGAVGLGAGLGAGALGAYGVNRAMGVGSASLEDTSSPAVASLLPAAAAPALASTATPATTQAKPAAPAAKAAPPAVVIAGANRVATPTTTPAAVDNTDYNAAFRQYMGGDFDINSSRDQAKMDYLRSLKEQNIDLNAANIYNPAYGYGKF